MLLVGYMDQLIHKKTQVEISSKANLLLVVVARIEKLYDLLTFSRESAQVFDDQGKQWFRCARSLPEIKEVTYGKKKRSLNQVKRRSQKVYEGVCVVGL
jgi:hypothetical protein